MASFLDTTGTSHHLEIVIKSAQERLILISPFLKLNDKIKGLLEDKDRLKIDVRVVYGKNELQPKDINWLRGLEFVRTSFCKNLHAKCYLNEESCIITSMNLYEFSQVNNYEMGVLIKRADDPTLYKDTYEEAKRIVRISRNDDTSNEDASSVEEPPVSYNEKKLEKLTSARLEQKLNMKTGELEKLLISKGYIELRNIKTYLTEKGKKAGGEFRKGKNGYYFLWPEDMDI